MIRVILDTNLIVSGLLAPGGPPARLIAEWRRGAFEVVGSPKLVAELEGVLARPKIRARIPLEDATAFLEEMRRVSVWLDDPPPARNLAPDPGDDFIVNIARAASCAAIVSGDRRLHSVRNPPVLTPRDFLDALIPE